ncbi:Norsolorinic acid reductase [Fusarium oxysporum f. sp. cubense race 1]|uniref:Norsolorinic acid reductase n=1 Tax=Fusarium oxysporum f. sp. cubense (strain race 1) TaxID=1229664 RepID=N4U1R3_FUSC1|nr:Norsolorinic acid reductase [Fusarium oxysporum f. sp. cubense race 1]
MALPFAPPPKSPLGRYRLLSPTASVWVSPICLGTMNFGNSWYEHHISNTRGGNFIDSANNYQFQETEKWVGEWMRKRGNRDEIVVATKYTTNFRAGPGAPNIMLYVHWYDGNTSIPELMQSLNQLVLSGKVLHLGVSDTPAWIVSKANEYARCNGLRQFSVYQGRWSAASRDFERDIIPMCQAEGMGIAPWGSLGGGKFKTEEQRNAREGRRVEASEKEIRTSKVLESIANRKNTLITSIALAYVMHKTSYVFPIIGGRKVDHLKANIQALTLHLSPEDIQEIDGANEFDAGFPNDFLYRGGNSIGGPDVWLLQMGGTFDHIQPPKVRSS